MVVIPIQNRAEVVPVRVNKKNFQDRDEERQPDSLRVHRDVKEQDDHDNRAQDGKRDSNVTADQQKHTGNDVKDSYKYEPAVFEKESEEDAWISRRGRHGDEVEEGVHSEDGEHETEKDAGDENGDLHEQFSLKTN